MKLAAVFAVLTLLLAGHNTPQNSPDPDLSAKRIETVVIGYSEKNRLGQLLLSNTDGRFEQYFDIWSKSAKDFAPIVITYVFEKRDDKGRRFYTATWGKGPVERQSFESSCLASVPEFKDDVYWVAKIVDGKVQFEVLDDRALKEGVIKVLFRSVKGTVQRWMFESASPVTSQAPHDDQRIIADLANRAENRKIWYAKGWLRPENRCVRYLQN